MTQDQIKDFTLRISQANTTDLVVVIYDITLCYLDEAKLALDNKDNRALTTAIVNVRKCINELIGSLHYDYSPAGELLDIYVFCSRRLSIVNSDKDYKELEEIHSIILRLRDAYSQISSTNKSGPIMQNSESVYAGLTYGKGMLNENVIGVGNRGFLA